MAKKKKTIETAAYVMLFHASFALLLLAISNIKIIIIDDKKKDNLSLINTKKYYPLIA